MVSILHFLLVQDKILSSLDYIPFLGASDLQEGSVSCLLSICKFNFEKIARSVMNWEYNEDLRPATKDKLNAFFKHHTIPWWRKFVQHNFPFSDKVN